MRYVDQPRPDSRALKVWKTRLTGAQLSSSMKFYVAKVRLLREHLSTALQLQIAKFVCARWTRLSAFYRWFRRERTELPIYKACRTSLSGSKIRQCPHLQLFTDLICVAALSEAGNVFGYSKSPIAQQLDRLISRYQQWMPKPWLFKFQKVWIRMGR
jgi:hypothetical protein